MTPNIRALERIGALLGRGLKHCSGEVDNEASLRSPLAAASSRSGGGGVGSPFRSLPPRFNLTYRVGGGAPATRPRLSPSVPSGGRQQTTVRWTATPFWSWGLTHRPAGPWVRFLLRGLTSAAEQLLEVGWYPPGPQRRLTAELACASRLGRPCERSPRVLRRRLHPAFGYTPGRRGTPPASLRRRRPLSAVAAPPRETLRAFPASKQASKQAGVR